MSRLLDMQLMHPPASSWAPCPHSLPSGWHVDQAIEVEEDRVVCIRFGHDWDPQCMVMDETLYSVQAKVQNFAVMYLGELLVLLLSKNK